MPRSLGWTLRALIKVRESVEPTSRPRARHASGSKRPRRHSAGYRPRATPPFARSQCVRSDLPACSTLEEIRLQATPRFAGRPEGCDSFSSRQQPLHALDSIRDKIKKNASEAHERTLTCTLASTMIQGKDRRPTVTEASPHTNSVCRRTGNDAEADRHTEFRLPTIRHRSRPTPDFKNFFRRY